MRNRIFHESIIMGKLYQTGMHYLNWETIRNEIYSKSKNSHVTSD